VGYTVLFSEEFFKASDRSESLQHSPLFKIGGTPVLKITEEQRLFLNSIFQKMMNEQQTDYTYKDDLIRNYINLIIHEALKMKPSENYQQHNNALSRLTSVFLELLERQFPIESVEKPLQLKTAQDFASALSVHPNYLSRAVKEVTGKPTTTHITERILNEAKALLQHTNRSKSTFAAHKLEYC
jgi:AraC family transcriptional regulator, transcriptional activator of pobA